MEIKKKSMELSFLQSRSVMVARGKYPSLPWLMVAKLYWLIKLCHFWKLGLFNEFGKNGKISIFIPQSRFPECKFSFRVPLRYCVTTWSLFHSLERYPNLNVLVKWFSILTMSLFGIFWHFLRTCLLHWLSATKESLVGHKNVFLKPFLWPTQCFFCRTDSVQRTNELMKWQYMSRKEIVQIENKCTKTVRLGYLRGAFHC